MSNCDYCGEKVSWFQSAHPACITRATDTGSTIKTLVRDETLAGKTYPQIDTEVQQALTDNRVPVKYVRESLLQGINDAASQIALGSPIPQEELIRVVDILQGFDITAYRTEWATRRWFGFAQLGMSHILWQVLHRVVPVFDGTIDFNLRGGEAPIFQTGTCVTYAEERTVSNHARSYGGLSIPVGGGIYYHVGASEAQPQQTSGLVPLDGGTILITSHSLYFGGSKTTLRIPLDQVLRYQYYVDAVGVCESHGAPKVFVFDYRGMDTGWFFYNLLSALSSSIAS